MTNKEFIERLKANDYIYETDEDGNVVITKTAGEIFEHHFKKLEEDLERLEKQDKLLHIFKNNMELVDYKGNGSTQAYKIIIEDKFTAEEDGEYVTCHNSDFDDIKEWLNGR